MVMDLAELLVPEPVAVHLDPTTSAIAVLDLSVRCDDPGEACSELIPGVASFLERARAAGVPVIYTSGYASRGTPDAEVATGLARRSDESLVHPDAFDKFHGGEMQSWLASHNTQSLVVVGSSTHVAVFATAMTAARVYKYDVVIPLDGVNSRNAIDHKAALHLLQAVPRAMPRVHITISTLDTISFE